MRMNADVKRRLKALGKIEQALENDDVGAASPKKINQARGLVFGVLFGIVFAICILPAEGLVFAMIVGGVLGAYVGNSVTTSKTWEAVAFNTLIEYDPVDTQAYATLQKRAADDNLSEKDIYDWVTHERSLVAPLLPAPKPADALRLRFANKALKEQNNG